MIDAHAHLDKYGDALPEALAQIRESSILTLSVSMDIASFQEALRISEADPLVLPCFGIHPWEAPRFSSDPTLLDPWIDSAVLIGEIGLDHFFVKDPEEYPAQDAIFRYFLDAAEDREMVINVHTPGAEQAVLEHLRGRSLPGIIIHWYSGPLELVDDFLELGAHFTIGVEVLRSKHIQSLARALPEERLLTETDNPGGWQWMEGELGFPKLLSQVESTLAEIRDMDREVLSARVTQNMVALLSKTNDHRVASAVQTQTAMQTQKAEPRETG